MAWGLGVNVNRMQESNENLQLPVTPYEYGDGYEYGYGDNYGDGGMKIWLVRQEMAREEIETLLNARMIRL